MGHVHNEGRRTHSMYLRPAPPPALPVWIGGNGPHPPLHQGMISGPAGHIVETLLSAGEIGVRDVVRSIGGSTRRRLATLDALIEAGLPTHS